MVIAYHEVKPIVGGPCAFMIFSTFRRVCNNFGECAAVSESVQQFRSECSTFGASAAVAESVQDFLIGFGECAAFWRMGSILEGVQPGWRIFTEFRV